MPEYKALILDLDGTLIGPDERISPRVAEAVKEVARKIGVSIATGRETGDILKYAGELGLTWPQISDNGAMIIDPESGDILWSAPLGEELSRKAMRPIIESGCEFFATHAGGAITDLANLDTWELTRVSALDLDVETADAMMESMANESGLDMVKVWLPYNQPVVGRGLHPERRPQGQRAASPVRNDRRRAVTDNRRGRQLQRQAAAGHRRTRHSHGQRPPRGPERRPPYRPARRTRRPRPRHRASHPAPALARRRPPDFRWLARSEYHAQRTLQQPLYLVDEERALRAVHYTMVG